MEKTNHDIERYLDDEMDAAERTAFEARLQAEPELVREVELARDIHRGLAQRLRREQQEAALSATLSELGDRHFSSESVSERPRLRLLRRKWMLISGVAAAVLLLIVFFPFGSGPDLNDYLHQHDPLLFTQLSTDAAADLANIQAAYDRRDYAQLRQLTGAYLQLHPNDAAVQLAKGISLYELEATAEAEEVFRNLANGDSAYKDYGSWYLALMYLQAGKEEEAKGYLRQIPAENTGLYTKAQELLE